MLQNRVIPCLLLNEESLVKTVQFHHYNYIGDPLNTCRIFNELEVDEMTILNIEATKMKTEPDYRLLNTLANECFMPLSYGGGINSLEQAKRIFALGYEKIVINSAAYACPDLITQVADIFGSQSIIVSMDVKKDLIGRYHLYSISGTHKEDRTLAEWISLAEGAGAGEILLTSINREGTWKGFDLELIQKVVSLSKIPVIAHGGAGCTADVEEAVNIAAASAVALGSMVVYQKKDMGVLINYRNDYAFHSIYNMEY